MTYELPKGIKNSLKKSYNTFDWHGDLVCLPRMTINFMHVIGQSGKIILSRMERTEQYWHKR